MSLSITDPGAQFPLFGSFLNTIAFRKRKIIRRVWEILTQLVGLLGRKQRDV
jgi:hypothetical protein